MRHRPLASLGSGPSLDLLHHCSGKAAAILPASRFLIPISTY